MLSYQDLLRVGENEADRMAFVQDVINSHKNSDLYKNAMVAESYYKKKNKTIMEFQKLLYTVTGEAIPDNYSADYKLRSLFFRRFVTQENQYLLSNGVSWDNPDTEDKVGTKRKSFDTQLQKAGIKALWGAVSFGFWNLDHMDVFDVLEYAPLWDENDGAMKAGVRFWQVDTSKPLRATLYELDGYTDYIWNKVENDGKVKFEGQILHEKRKYVQIAVSSEADGTEILDGVNYDGFPIVPLWGNPDHQTELEGLREQIDCYDLIKSGFANTVDEASYIYWAIQNAGGMDDIDLANFVERMKTVHAGLVEDSNAKAEAHTIEAPYASREALLERLRNDLYDFEEQIYDFVQGILFLAGIDDEPTFTRSRIANFTEEIQTIISAGIYLERGYVTEKILTLLGDGDKAEEMIKQMDADEIRPLGSYEEVEEDVNGEEDNV